MKPIVEVCAGSLQDCLAAEKAKADRIELNNAVHMGGLTPSIATLILAKEQVKLPIITMVRPRGGGFHYNQEELATMRLDAKYLLENGADGLAFGFLRANNTIDESLTKEFTDLCHQYGAEAVFHRAFDQTNDPKAALETLISLKVDRILTSGQKDKAIEAISLLKDLNIQSNGRIEICLGSGINSENVLELINETNINQVHASFKEWEKDPTTTTQFVDYRYSVHGDYEVSSSSKISQVVKLINE